MSLIKFKDFFEILEDENNILFVIDEVGFGTRNKNARNYAYSKIGEPAILERRKSLAKNLTCTTTISLNGVELLRFFSGGGTRNEYFEEYFDTLLE